MITTETPDPKTPEQFRKFTEGIEARVGDYFDGYVLVGITADTGDPVIILDNKRVDFKTIAALNALLLSAIRAPGIRNG